MTDNTAAPDSDLQLKKRARRRLVGAVALALLAAVVLPMVMDHEPRPTQQDIQVRIPSQDAGSFTSRVLPGAPAATPLPPARETAPAAAVPAAEDAAPPAPAETKPEPKPEAKPEPKSDAKPAAAKPEAKSKPDADTHGAAKSAEALRAERILNGGADAAAARSAQWVLQLGAYQDQGNVKVLQGKLKELGYPSYTEKVSTPQGERTRVRAGPFASKAAAEKAQAALKRIGAGGPPGGVLAQK